MAEKMFGFSQPLKAFDLGDGTCALAVKAVVLPVGTTHDPVRPSALLPIKIFPNGDGSYSVAAIVIGDEVSDGG